MHIGRWSQSHHREATVRLTSVLGLAFATLAVIVWASTRTLVVGTLGVVRGIVAAGAMGWRNLRWWKEAMV